MSISVLTIKMQFLHCYLNLQTIILLRTRVFYFISQEIANWMGIKQSKIVKNSKHYNLNPSAGYLSPDRQKYFTKCVPLHKAALKGDWIAAQSLFANDPTLITTPITEGGETALHIAAVEGHHNFAVKLLDMMDETDLEIQNAKGSTALCFAAAAGHVDIAKLMVMKNVNLAKVRGGNGITPLYMATLQGYNEMAQYLYPLSDFESWTIDDQIALLTTSIDSELYGLAMRIVDQYKTLAIAKDSNGESPLQVLARKPMAFSCNSRHEHWVNTLLPYRKLKTHNINAQCDAYTLLGSLWDSAICQDDIEMGQVGHMSKLIFIAAESGNEEFLVELILRYPDFLYKVNESKHSIFHIAVLHRYVKVFNLMYELGGVKDLIATYIDTDGNNILHLAAKLAPQNQLNSIPGAALQMQREVLWYKEVEKLVRPIYRSMKNRVGQTPYDLFLAEHQELMKEGEKLMKQTAKSCMLVTMLIATVVFTTAFTVPGGYNNNTGAPILANKRLFMVFPVSEAVATLSSLTSMLMFLSILTSRYSDDDFLRSLPFWLVIGVAALFISIVAMMVAFCTCLLFFQHGWATVTVLLVFFASVPVMFVVLKYPLLITILRCTYSCRWLFQSNNRLHV